MAQTTRTNIQLVYKDRTQNWTVSIEGKTHHDLTSIAVGDLIEYTLMVTEQTKGKGSGYDDDGE